MYIVPLHMSALKTLFYSRLVCDRFPQKLILRRLQVCVCAGMYVSETVSHQHCRASLCSQSKQKLLRGRGQCKVARVSVEMGFLHIAPVDARTKGWGAFTESHQ